MKISRRPLAGMFVLAILLSIAVSCEALANCTSPWIGLYKNNCYFFSTTLETWGEARISCILKGGHLVTINDANEHMALKIRLSMKRYRQMNFWTGGTDFGSEGVWRWDDGHSMTYVNWQPGQPHGKYNENCMFIGVSSHYSWADLTCDKSEFYICEKEM